MKWFLFFLASAAYFLIRLDGRKDKTQKLDFIFWVKHNWVQVSAVFLIDLIVMILLTDSSIDLTLWLSKQVPEGLVSLIILAIPVACGLGLGWGIYEFVKLFLKKKADNSLIAKNDKP